MLVTRSFDIDAAWRISRGQSPNRPDLAPPLRWQGLLPFNVALVSFGTSWPKQSNPLAHSLRTQDNYYLSYGHATTDSAMDQAKDLTTVVLLYLDPKSHELTFVGYNTLPGESHIGVAQDANGDYSCTRLIRENADPVER
jgi:hypothetical protein